MPTRPKHFRPSGAGELHLGECGGWFDALVEMLLLGEVDYLERFPPGRHFAFWGAAMSGRRAREPGNLARPIPSNETTGQRGG